jgi:aminoglycoside phosphotransferase (APT) family kinase protein
MAHGFDLNPEDQRLLRGPVPDKAWLCGIAALDGPVPSDERVFIHRDFHPGNVLWRDGEVTGVVDWVNASIGSPWADVGFAA